MSEQLALMPEYLTAHLQLTLLALLVSIAVSVPLGIFVTRARYLEQPILGVAGVIQTVPSLALLAVMVPVLAAIGLQSIGFLPAFIGLTLYGVLPVLRNTVTGIAGVPPALTEAAQGVGMTPAQQLRRVELPLAMPVIIAGIRTATVWVVGIATLSTPVGAPSLGNYIFSGLQTRNYTAVLVGCVAAAAVALVLDALVRMLETGVRARRRRTVATAAALLVCLYGYTGVTLTSGLASGTRAPVVIGAKTFTEQYILSEILGQHITAVTAEPTRVVQSLGSTVAFDALAAGDIDIYVDYSGTLWTTVMRREDVPAHRQTVLDELARFLRTEHDIMLVGVLGFENAYALAMRGDAARALRIERISQLTPHAPRMTVGGDYEFFARPEWKAIRASYGLAFASRRSMDASLMYQAVAQGSVDVISAFSTDGRIAALDLQVLTDDRAAIPPYDAVILAGPGVAAERPAVVEALRRLIGTIDAEGMRRMNRAVDDGGQTAAAVAERFLGDEIGSNGFVAE